MSVVFLSTTFTLIGTNNRGLLYRWVITVIDEMANKDCHLSQDFLDLNPRIKNSLLTGV